MRTIAKHLHAHVNSFSRAQNIYFVHVKVCILYLLFFILGTLCLVTEENQ